MVSLIEAALAAVMSCLFWRPVADARVASLAIVENLDVFEEGGSGLAPGDEPRSMHGLGLERSEEALHGRVVEAVAFAAHGSLETIKPK